MNCKSHIFFFRNECLKLSPINTLNTLNFSYIGNYIKVFVVYAENDSPAFHYQSSQFTKVCIFLKFILLIIQPFYNNIIKLTISIN